VRVPNAVHETHAWRIREIVPDFTLEDVWALPVHGEADEFESLLDVMSSLDFPSASSLPTRVLWRTRDCLGHWFALGRVSSATDRPEETIGQRPIPGTNQTSLADRLPDELRGTAWPVLGQPFVPLYRTDDEYAAELSNRTVHAVLHLAWADQGDDDHQAQMAVYVKPRGRLGAAYMAFIRPFRHAIVYPALMHHIERAWITRADRRIRR
jgi:Protein of unknown function (DUF2867)